MPQVTRRQFLGGAAATGLLAVLPPEMVESFARPAVTGSLADVRHVVILMQENRSFDHYYGTMSGVRGFGDRALVRQPDGQDVLHQPVTGGYRLPWRVNTTVVAGQDDPSMDHSWGGQHRGVGGGQNNGWATHNEVTMGYFTDEDIPFHRALADAFTLCDHYHCSVQGPTTPNRLYLFSGKAEGSAATSNPADYEPVYSWLTYPEFLQDRGIPWKVYANDEVGDDTGNHPWVGDYGDNPLWLFHNYHNDYSSELSRNARVADTWKPDSGNGKQPHHVLADFRADCADGSLPAVSWIVAPFGYCEHPESRPLNGAIYTQAVLTALWSNQDLWNSTAVLITYDENDGLFDHVPPPMPPAGTAGEFVGSEPIGLGPRVPMTVISPWSRGGWVSSQIFDHTSVIRFIGSWQHPDDPFPNITAWRRTVCGDLTGCFDFAAPDASIPSLPAMPTHAVARGDADDPERGLPAAEPPPLDAQTPPGQDPGQRNARPLPYQLTAATLLSDDRNILTTIFTNTGSAGVAVSAHRADGQTDGPWPYVVPAGGEPQTDDWRIQAYGGGKYHVAIHGPNRFLWEFAGDANSAAAGVEVTGSYTDDGRLLLTMKNKSPIEVTITVAANHYRSDGPWAYDLAAGSTIDTESWNLAWFDGWYDLSATTTGDPTFLRRFTGHYEKGEPSKTG